MPELVPIRYGRMLVSPFTFFRGAALIMASDLAASPNAGITVQLCGDAHLSNFGVFASPERQMMFDINDFDETLPGPWEWDVKRLAASFEVGGRDSGFSRADRRQIVLACVNAYRDVMREAAGMNTLDAWYAHMEIGAVIDLLDTEVREKRLGRREAKEAAQDIAKARTRDHSRVFSRLTDDLDGDRLIVADPPLIVPIEDLAEPGTDLEDIDDSMRRLINSYRKTLANEHHPLDEYTYLHTARKVVGVGSVGTRAWVLLLVGRDDEDPLFLQAKEAQPSVLERFIGASESRQPRATRRGGSAPDAGGQRHLPGVAARAGPGRSDARLLRAPAPRLEGLGRCRDLPCPRRHDLRADVRRHARAGARAVGRPHRRRLPTSARATAFDRSIADFASAYADQNERDYQALVDAVGSGRIEAQTGL